MCIGIGDKPTGEPKVDEVAVNGLAGVEDSLAYKVAELERHAHSWERWFGAATVPAGETHVADRINDTSAPFQMDAGNDTWGAWVQVLGSTDLPVVAGRVKYDIHKLVFTDVEKNGKIHKLQIAFGASGAAALAAETYTELIFFSSLGFPGDALPARLQTRRQGVDTKIWARVWVVGENTGTIDFFYGLHEYEG